MYNEVLTHYVYNIMAMLPLTLVENSELKIFSGH